MVRQQVKVFSHNDLDGFGAPLLLKVLNEQVFPETTFDISNIGAGKIDAELDYWLNSSDIGAYSDVYIMDMTPDSAHTFQELDSHFANHWLVFDHHETEAAAREKYHDNSISSNGNKNASATSLVWEWLQQQKGFNTVDDSQRNKLAKVVELIRAYDTWDWQNDPDMDDTMRTEADELDQLFWFYPIDHSADFVEKVLKTGWDSYRQENQLLIQTLNDRRAHYLKTHLKDTLIDELDGHKWGFVYADDYKSEIAHELLQEYPEVEAAMVITPKSISLRSNGRIDVAKFAEKYFHGGGHADAAGGQIDINMIQVGEKAVIDGIKQSIANMQIEEESRQDTLADNLDPEVAAKMKALFGDK